MALLQAGDAGCDTAPGALRTDGVGYAAGLGFAPADPDGPLARNPAADAPVRATEPAPAAGAPRLRAAALAHEEEGHGSRTRVRTDHGTDVVDRHLAGERRRERTDHLGKLFCLLTAVGM